MSVKAEDLELQKLRLEIRELERPFWRKTGFIVPLFAALISILLGYYSGWFDVQTKLLDIKRANLREQVQAFKVEKDLLEKSALQLSARNAELKKSNLLLVAEKMVLSDQVALAKNIREAQTTYISTEVLRFKELGRRGELPDCKDFDKFFEAIEDRFFRINGGQFTAEMELIEFQAETDDQFLREQKLIEYMNSRGMLDEDGCFTDHNGETHCTNF